PVRRHRRVAPVLLVRDPAHSLPSCVRTPRAHLPVVRGRARTGPASCPSEYSVHWSRQLWSCRFGSLPVTRPNLIQDPGFCHAQIAIDRGFGDLEHLRDLLIRETAEVVHLDRFGDAWILRCQLCERLVDFEDVDIAASRRSEVHVLEL